VFREESDEHLQVINRSLVALEQLVVEPVSLSAGIRDRLGEMRRAVHTLKGAAAMVGYGQIAGCAHSLEDLLDWLHDAIDHIGPSDLRIIAAAIDLIESLAALPGSDRAAEMAGLQQVIADHLRGGQAVTEVAEPESAPTEGVFSPEISADLEGLPLAEGPSEKPGQPGHPAGEIEVAPATGNLRVKTDSLDEIIRIEGELVVARSSMEGILNEVKQSVDELQSAQGKLRRIAQELEAGFEVQALYGFGPETLGGQEVAGGKSGSSFSEFDPIELDRYSKLNLIIRSLNELSVDINSIHAGMAGQFGELAGYVARQQLIMGAMQDKLMRIRMTPMSSFSRAFFRTVRNTSAQLAKNVRLTITGDDVFMDRFIWSKITDPIMHILRNSVDHGIETTAVRLQNGKPEAASIRIEAEQRGSFVVLRISDDGAGIDMAMLREKLRETGKVRNPEQLADEELLPYLFTTGLSTRDEVSQVSGRGVGLDVVLKNIQELRGSVHVETRAGEGTAFELRIPITLSINKAILVIAEERPYAIPLQDIVEISSIALNDIDSRSQLLKWREDRLPVKDLSVLLRLRGQLAPEAMAAGSCTALIVRAGRGHAAVIVDGIREQREIVIKDLGSYLTHVKGVSGVTILGDGSLIPVLNLSELVDERLATPAEEVPQVPARELPLKVLIVDDSISVRQSVARLVRRQSWRPEMAVDGVDALDKLEHFHPDVIVLDIEMPRMNGYELMSILRKNEEYRSIPVVMLTSRTSEKHRMKAEELGVDFYLSKPFQDEPFIQLLGGIRQYRQSRSLPAAG
jgi:chemosensory pili system protein ChpA (sensor histidine kinase/response regulator)